MARLSVIDLADAPKRKRNRKPSGFRPKVWLECDECGKGFLRERQIQVGRLKYTNAKHVWCTKQCQGKWLGRNHGGSNRKAA